MRKTWLRVRNASERVVRLVLEPWGEQYRMDPKEAIEAVFTSPKPGTPEIEYRDEAIVLYGFAESDVTLYQGTLEPLRSEPPSPLEIIQEEIERAGLPLSADPGKWDLNELEASLLATKVHQLDVPAMGHDDEQILTSATILAGILAQRMDAGTKKTLWRIVARTLSAVQLNLKLQPDSADELFQRARQTITPPDDYDPLALFPWLNENSVNLMSIFDQSDSPKDSQEEDASGNRKNLDISD